MKTSREEEKKERDRAKKNLTPKRKLRNVIQVERDETNSFKKKKTTQTNKKETDEKDRDSRLEAERVRSDRMDIAKSEGQAEGERDRA